MNVDEESLKHLKNYYLGRTIKINDKSYCLVKVLDVLAVGLLIEPVNESADPHYTHYYPQGSESVYIYGPTLIPWTQIHGITLSAAHPEDADGIRQKALNYMKETNIRLSAEKYSADPGKES